MSPTVRRPSSRFAALAVLALLGAGAAFGDVPAPPPAPAPAPAPADGPTPAPAPAPSTPDAARREEVLRIVDALRIEASRIRGLPWKQEVPADLISREQLRKNLEEMIKEELKPDEYERDLRMLRRLGLLREDEDPIQIQLKFLEQGIAGYFNPKTKRFYVIDGLTGDGQRPTILHELVHALEDQYIDLEKTQKALEKDGDRLFALKCLIEGSAEHARLQYQKEHPDIARLAMREQTTSKSAAEMQRILATVPALLILPTLLQYQTGPAFVSRAVGAEYAKGMERLYADPPVSEEQVLHPSKYLGAARDLPRRITWPADLAATLGAGWKGHEASPVGELDFALWMDRWFGETGGRLDLRLMGQGRFWTKTAQTAAQGWDGMWSQVFDKDGVTTGYALVSGWDSPGDAREAAEAVEKALRTQYAGRFVSEGWKDGEDGVRTLDFEGGFGPGRIEIRGEEVRAADGFPDGSLARIWPRLAAVAVARDPADTWTADGEPDPLAGAAWRSEPNGVAWKATEGWTLEKQADGTAKARTGELTARLSARPGGINENLLKLVVELKGRYPKGVLDLSKAEELTVGTKQAGRLRADDGGAETGAKNREVYVVPTGDALLVVEFEGPRSEWGASRSKIDAFLGNLQFRD
jgi:Zn-dependent peptidase ImmA (M78 family)